MSFRHGTARPLRPAFLRMLMASKREDRWKTRRDDEKEAERRLYGGRERVEIERAGGSGLQRGSGRSVENASCSLSLDDSELGPDEPIAYCSRCGDRGYDAVGIPCECRDRPS